MSGIQFVVDAKGKKKAVVIDLKQHHQLWEDFYDTMLVHSRQQEPRESLKLVEHRLRPKRPLHG